MKHIKISAFLILTCLFANSLKADEGMWQISNIDSLIIQKMKQSGLIISSDQIYSKDKASLKDAVIIFDNGCTAEVVSANGLILTNHHCGQDRVQQISTSQNNYLRDGFWAKSQNEEVPLKGLTVKFLIREIDVTSQAKDLLKTQTLRKVQSEIEKQFSDSSKKFEASLDGYHDGEKYILSLYQTFSDIRLVGVPPVNIGNFGGDADNFEWPRHSGDFSFFRIYADANNNPSAYSPNNKPYKPLKYLPISIAGIKDNDFTLTIGFPGITHRYVTSSELKEIQEVRNPANVITKTKRLEILKREMDEDENIRLKYSAKYFSSSNSCKLSLGSLKSIGKSTALNDKQEQEADFQKWADSNPEYQKKYGSCLETIHKNFDKQRDAKYAHTFINSALATDAFLFGARTRIISDLTSSKRTGNLSKALESFRTWYESFVKDYDYETDKKITREMVKLVFKNVKKNYLPTFYTIIENEYHGNIDQYVDDLYAKSTFGSRDGVYKFLKDPAVVSLEKDPLFIFGTSIYDKLIDLKKETTQTSEDIKKATRLYHEGLREKVPSLKKYPDANFTMRFTYGKVGGLSPRDGVEYNSQTTLQGVIEKDDTSIYEFRVPEKLKQLYNKKDYGRYADHGKLYTCFLSNTDITGGNSGSPVLNGKGELIGLAFDGNFESLAGDVVYEPTKNRSINVDIRYVMFITEKFAGVQRIIKELSIK